MTVPLLLVQAINTSTLGCFHCGLLIASACSNSRGGKPDSGMLKTAWHCCCCCSHVSQHLTCSEPWWWWCLHCDYADTIHAFTSAVTHLTPSCSPPFLLDACRLLLWHAATQDLEEAWQRHVEDSLALLLLAAAAAHTLLTAIAPQYTT
jgi:hypothetical protein